MLLLHYCFSTFKKKIYQEAILYISDVDFKYQASSRLSGWRITEMSFCIKNESGESVMKSGFGFGQNCRASFTEDILRYHRMLFYMKSALDNSKNQCYMKYF